MIPENETKNWSDIDEEEQKDKKLNKDASPFVPSTQIVEKEEISIITEKGDNNSSLEKVSDFSLLGLHPLLLKGVIEVKGFNKPSKIQEYALPIMIGTDKNNPQNFIGQAKAGSGKTAAFVLGMFSHIDYQVKAPQGIIVCPTRELSVQVYDEVNKFGKFLIEQEGLGVFLAVPKDEKNSFEKKSRDNKPIKDTVIVGTPGKLMDLIKNKTIDVKNIKVLVLDEADFVLSAMVDTIKRIRYEIQKQTKPFIYLFSATFPQRVRDFAKEFVNKPYKHLYLNLDELNIEEILQYKVDCISNNSDKRLEIIQIVFRCITSTKMIVFFNRKDELDKVEKKLRSSGFDDIFVVHGNLDNKERETNMLKFKEAPKGILITTNVLARGIDVEGVNVVINYDLPVDYEKFKQGTKVEDIDTYLHRVGRTGRFGYSGIAINLIADKDDSNIMKNIEKKLEAKIQILDEKDIQERLEKDEEIVEKKNEKRKDEIKNHHYDQYK